MDHISSVFKANEKNKVAEFKNLLEIPKVLSHFSPLYMQIKFKPRLNIRIREHARSQKFAMGDCFRSPQRSKISHFFAKTT